MNLWKRGKADIKYVKEETVNRKEKRAKMKKNKKIEWKN